MTRKECRIWGDGQGKDDHVSLVDGGREGWKRQLAESAGRQGHSGGRGQTGLFSFCGANQFDIQRAGCKNCLSGVKPGAGHFNWSLRAVGDGYN